MSSAPFLFTIYLAMWDSFLLEASVWNCVYAHVCVCVHACVYVCMCVRMCRCPCTMTQLGSVRVQSQNWSLPSTLLETGSPDAQHCSWQARWPLSSWDSPSFFLPAALGSQPCYQRCVLTVLCVFWESRLRSSALAIFPDLTFESMWVKYSTILS